MASFVRKILRNRARRRVAPWPLPLATTEDGRFEDGSSESEVDIEEIDRRIKRLNPNYVVVPQDWDVVEDQGLSLERDSVRCSPFRRCGLPVRSSRREERDFLAELLANVGPEKSEQDDSGSAASQRQLSTDRKSTSGRTTVGCFPWRRVSWQTGSDGDEDDDVDDYASETEESLAELERRIGRLHPAIVHPQNWDDGQKLSFERDSALRSLFRRCFKSCKSSRREESDFLAELLANVGPEESGQDESGPAASKEQLSTTGRFSSGCTIVGNCFPCRRASSQSGSNGLGNDEDDVKDGYASETEESLAELERRISRLNPAIVRPQNWDDGQKLSFERDSPLRSLFCRCFKSCMSSRHEESAFLAELLANVGPDESGRDESSSTASQEVSTDKKTTSLFSSMGCFPFRRVLFESGSDDDNNDESIDEDDDDDTSDPNDSDFTDDDDSTGDADSDESSLTWEEDGWPIHFRKSTSSLSLKSVWRRCLPCIRNPKAEPSPSLNSAELSQQMEEMEEEFEREVLARREARKQGYAPKRKTWRSLVRSCLPFLWKKKVAPVDSSVSDGAVSSSLARRWSSDLSRMLREVRSVDFEEFQPEEEEELRQAEEERVRREARRDGKPRDSSGKPWRFNRINRQSMKGYRVQDLKQRSVFDWPTFYEELATLERNDDPATDSAEGADDVEDDIGASSRYLGGDAPVDQGSIPTGPSDEQPRAPRPNRVNRRMPPSPPPEGRARGEAEDRWSEDNQSTHSTYSVEDAIELAYVYNGGDNFQFMPPSPPSPPSPSP